MGYPLLITVDLEMIIFYRYRIKLVERLKNYM